MICIIPSLLSVISSHGHTAMTIWWCSILQLISGGSVRHSFVFWNCDEFTFEMIPMTITGYANLGFMVENILLHSILPFLKNWIWFASIWITIANVEAKFNTRYVAKKKTAHWLILGAYAGLYPYKPM